jgi:medium-chain acyl-[acyl-carrier-protein] hydrolase
MLTDTKWLYLPARNPRAQLRLFCFPYAGGDARIYRTWPKALPTFAELVAIQLPGRGNRLGEPPFRRLSSLVERIVEELDSVLREKPVVLFGHSMGAIVSFEVARQMTSGFGIHPLTLLVSGRSAPHIPSNKTKIYDLPDEEFTKELSRLNGTRKETFDCKELMQLMIPVLRADFEVCETYEYIASAPLPCPIAAFGGLMDTEVTQERLNGWKEHTSSTFTARMLPGDHFFLHAQERLVVDLVARELSRSYRRSA